MSTVVCAAADVENNVKTPNQSVRSLMKHLLRRTNDGPLPLERTLVHLAHFPGILRVRTRKWMISLVTQCAQYLKLDLVYALKKDLLWPSCRMAAAFACTCCHA